MATNLLSKQMSIVIDGSALGCATDFSLSINKDTIEVACLGSAAAKRVIPDLYSWSISFSGLVMTSATGTGQTFDNLMTKILSATSKDVSTYILPDVSSNKYYVGGGILSSLTMDGGVGSPVTFSGEVTGNGTLIALTTT